MTATITRNGNGLSAALVKLASSSEGAAFAKNILVELGAGKLKFGNFQGHAVIPASVAMKVFETSTTWYTWLERYSEHLRTVGMIIAKGDEVSHVENFCRSLGYSASLTCAMRNSCNNRKGLRLLSAQALVFLLMCLSDNEAGKRIRAICGVSPLWTIEQVFVAAGLQKYVAVSGTTLDEEVRIVKEAEHPSSTAFEQRDPAPTEEISSAFMATVDVSSLVPTTPAPIANTSSTIGAAVQLLQDGVSERMAQREALMIKVDALNLEIHDLQKAIQKLES